MCLFYIIITSSEHPDGKFSAEIANPAVDEKLLEEIWCMQSHSISWSDIIHRLHIRTTPAGYVSSMETRLLSNLYEFFSRIKRVT